MQIISKVALITINETLFIQLISFFIFLWCINRILFRPLNETMKERDAYLINIKDEIRHAEDTIDSITHQLINQEKKTREEAEHMVRMMIAEGNEESEKIISRMVDEINKERDRVAEEVHRQLDVARKSLKEESEILAIGMMEKILERRLDV